MNNIINASDSSMRLIVFIGVLVIMLLLESLFPRKQRVQHRKRRWLTNLGLVFINTIAIKLLLPVAALGVAAYASSKGWGLFNYLNWPAWIEITLTVIILDMLIYWQHIASHHIPLLWSVHQIHHVDRDIDVTTGIRFHPIEIVLSMIYKMICVLLLGPAVFAVFLFEVILNASSMFNHANFAIPVKIDRLLRAVIVTPDMHRVHHSTLPRETNSNYGFNLSIWDHLFSSYIPQPKAGHDSVVIGLAEQQNDNPASLFWCLLRPLHDFLRK